ncbi:MAG: formate--phosphoribosylaminoimidazolecarboxamide ligase family protein [Candidatus Aenigmarchaeota archaeon]|nr:formate--phosphoribosylaminoimidazolecarboxamide ligase family protein [Candidatus Aenigmarchaeota archaeon]
MVSTADAGRIAASYQSFSIGMLGSHSALEIASGAKKQGCRTMVFCQKGREQTYAKHYRNLFDDIVLVDKFQEIVERKNLERLHAAGTIFVPNRSFAVYVGYDNIEAKFDVPLFGSRSMLRAEERDVQRNQYYLLEQAKISTPRRFANPDEIDRLCIVKVPEAGRKLERAFFYAASPAEYRNKLQERMRTGMVAVQDASKAVIEEFVVGAYFNANFFFSPLQQELELLGFDRRIQSDLDGILHLPAEQQLEIKRATQNIEVGHMPATMRESLLEKVFVAGENFVKAAKAEYPPGMLGTFALQGSITKDLEFVVFDVSMRMPGSPVLESFSPYTTYKYGRHVSPGERTAMEIKRAFAEHRLAEIVT